MERDRKSEHNQQIHDRKKLEREQRGRMRFKMPAPRFAPKVVIPEVPEGMELHKFYGAPVLLPARLDGEPMLGRSPFTIRQAEALQRLVEQRNYELFIRPEEDLIRETGIDPL